MTYHLFAATGPAASGTLRSVGVEHTLAEARSRLASWLVNHPGYEGLIQRHANHLFHRPRVWTMSPRGARRIVNNNPLARRAQSQ